MLDSIAGKKYVLVTAAYNEEQYIEKLIKSIIAQTLLPCRWVIVSDASTDRTDEIVRQYAARHGFIELLRITEDHPRNFSAQVNAINAGLARLTDVEYDYIGNLDADVSFNSTYFQELLDILASDPRLGLTGGSIFEEHRGVFKPRALNTSDSVAHAVQLFRRDCFQELGCYLALPYGGPDWYAVVRTRMNGWRVRSIPELEVRHYRPTGGASTWARSSYRQGRMDFSLGSHPLFELFRLARRLQSRPLFLNAFMRLLGFLTGYWRAEKRMVSPEFVIFLRQEERARFKEFVRHLLGPPALMRLRKQQSIER